MNTHNDTTQTTDPATKASPHITIELERLAALSPKGAYRLGGAIDTLNRVITGLISQIPSDNDAGLILCELTHFLAMLHAGIGEAVENRTSDGVEEINLQFWTILQYRAGLVYYLEDMIPGYGEVNIPDIGVLTATAIRDISEAKRKAREQAFADAMGES
jgi:hypothetical protein